MSTTKRTTPPHYFALCLLFCAQLLVVEAVAAKDTMRCGTRLVKKNDLAVQVREKCGNPISIDVIGYALSNDRRYTKKYDTSRQREYRVEQWIYGPKRGFYREVIFEAGRVKRINSIKQ